jgi:ubiquinone/menaquinone biosynthesis C-methylase UbiE
MSLRQYGQVFDAVAENYDAYRSGYPAALIDLALERGSLRPGSRVVEVGSGTGKLTEALVERGLVVDAVEPGANMIAAAERRVGDNASVRFHLGRFEDVELPEGTFDAVFSGTAFHWIEPHVGWTKVAKLLKPRGLLALLVLSGIREPHTADFEDELIAVGEKYAPGLDRHPSRELGVTLGGVPERSGNVSAVWDWVMSDGRHDLTVAEAEGLFDDVDVTADLREDERTADQIMAQFKTTSLWFRVDPDKRDALEAEDREVIARHGGLIRSTLATFLMTARKV